MNFDFKHFESTLNSIPENGKIWPEYIHYKQGAVVTPDSSAGIIVHKFVTFLLLKNQPYYILVLQYYHDSFENALEKFKKEVENCYNNHKFSPDTRIDGEGPIYWKLVSKPRA